MHSTLPAQLVAIHGRGVLAHDEPFVYADDLGLTRGLGCFDATLLVTDGAGSGFAHQVGEHVRRLEHSAKVLRIAGPPASAWEDLVDEATRAWVERCAGSGPVEAGLKLVLTAGREEAGGDPLAYLTVTALSEESLAQRSGIAVVTLTRGHAADAYADAEWLLGGVKTVAYAVNLAAKQAAADRGAQDALFVSTDGYALEGPTSALVVRHGDVLVTTPAGPTGILASITAATIMEAAPSAGLTPQVRLLRPQEVVRSDGAWLVSSVRGIAPITSLDGHGIPHDPTDSRLIADLAGFGPLRGM